MPYGRGVLSVITLLLTSCSLYTPKMNQNRFYENEGEEKEIPEVISHQRVPASTPISFNFEKNDLSDLLDDLYKNHGRTKAWLDYFLTRGEAFFTKAYTNGRHFRPLIDSILTKTGVPSELFFLGLIESGYSLRAYSRAHAVGPWQFMKGTAKPYRLTVSSRIDERRSLHKSTQAAALYLKDLYNIFGDWALAVMAYNSGEYRILRAIRKGNTRNFTELFKKHLLPQETIDYLPKMAAAREVYQNMEKYFPEVVEQVEKASEDDFSTIHEWERVEIKKSFSVPRLAKELGVTKSYLKKISPELRREAIYLGRKETLELYWPKKLSDSFQEKVASLSSWKLKASSPRRSIASRSHHRVRRGENLNIIARKYKMTLAQLKRLNNLRKNRIYPGQKLKVAGSASLVKKHVVKKGEALSTIAEKYGVSLRDLMKSNGLKNSRIRINQVLEIPLKNAITSS